MLYLFGQGERADYFRHLKYLQEHEKLLSDLSETELNTLCFEVDYCVEKQQYKVCEYDIVIEDSDTFVRRTVLKEKIQKIYEDSHQNYGALKLLQNYGNPENVFPKKQLEIICVKWELKPNR